MTLEDAVIGLKAYKEVDERMEQFWRNLDAAIVSPRMDTKAGSCPRVQVSGDVLELDGKADQSVQALLSDLDKVLSLIASKLPADLLHSLCGFMMNDIIPRLVRNWLSPAVPSSLKGIPQFESMIEEARVFCTSLEEHGYIGFDELQMWVDNAPTIWLGKCRETSLDFIRTRLTNGIGKSRQVEKVEKHMVSLSEGKELATTGAGASAETNDWGDDWGDAWDDDGDQIDDSSQAKEEGTKVKGADTQPEDDGADAWGWDDDDGEKPAKEQKHSGAKDDEDESAEAWGWGDEDSAQEPGPQPTSKPPTKCAPRHGPEETRELVLKETYHISSMPEPVLELIFAILEDAATLTKGASEHGPIASTAPWLFDLPTSTLALFRAISPHYYALDGGGNMQVLL
jgi:centromere/kinetochore protein ZW10